MLFSAIILRVLTVNAGWCPFLDGDDIVLLASVLGLAEVLGAIPMGRDYQLTLEVSQP